MGDKKGGGGWGGLNARKSPLADLASSSPSPALSSSLSALSLNNNNSKSNKDNKDNKDKNNKSSSSGSKGDVEDPPRFTYVKREKPQGPKLWESLTLPLDAEVVYIQNFIPEERRLQLYTALAKDIPFSKGKNRDTCLFGDKGVVYRYSVGAGYGEETVPELWIPDLLWIKGEVEKYTKTTFNICLAGWYADGRKCIGHHSDREEMGKETPIASVSLGAPRTFEFRAKKGDEKYSLTLHDGSLIVMGLHCQDRYTHSVPREPDIKAGRINLTFRHS